MNYLLLINVEKFLSVTLIILGALIFIALLIVFFTFLKFKNSFGRSNEISTELKEEYKPYREMMRKGAEYFDSLNPQEVFITSNDNLKLRGRLYEHPNSKGTVIFAHGYHGHPAHDFGPVLHHFKDLGFSLLLIDQRAHGKSEGKYLTFGVKESEDCLLWARFIANRYPGKSISLHGISMGGATVGMAGALDLPKEVKLIAIDCGFTSPDEIVGSVRKGMGLPAFPFQNIIRFFAKKFARFDMQSKSTADCLAKCTLPTLFIHGVADDYVPFYMGKEAYERSASVDKVMVAVEGAGHGLAYITEPERVTQILTDFYLKHM